MKLTWAPRGKSHVLLVDGRVPTEPPLYSYVTVKSCYVVAWAGHEREEFRTIQEAKAYVEVCYRIGGRG